MLTQQKQSYWIFLIPYAAVFIWSLNIAVTRYAADYISAVSISFYRWLLALIILTPFLLPKVQKIWPEIQPHLAKLFCLSALGMVLYQGFAYSAAHYTTATNMGLINAFIPIFTVLLGVFILKIKPPVWVIFGALLSFLGLMIVMSQGEAHFLQQNTVQLRGDGLMILAVFFYAGYGVFLQKWALGLPLMISLYLQICFAVLLHLPFIAWLGLDVITCETAASIIYAGVFPSIAAPLLWMLAVQKMGSNKSSIFMNLMPVMSAVIAYFWLKEAWTMYHTVGGSIILLGVAIAQYAKSRS
jgi:drug/metabolite transporter (DMT)-like permease